MLAPNRYFSWIGQLDSQDRCAYRLYRDENRAKMKKHLIAGHDDQLDADFFIRQRVRQPFPDELQYFAEPPNRVV